MGFRAPSKAVFVVTLVACFLFSTSAEATHRQGILRLRGGGLRGQSGGGVAGGGRRNAKGASGGGWWREKQVVVKDESITVQKVNFNHNPQLITRLSNFPTSPPRVPHFFEHLAQMPRVLVSLCFKIRLRPSGVCIRGLVTDRLYRGRSWPYLALFSRLIFPTSPSFSLSHPRPPFPIVMHLCFRPGARGMLSDRSGVCPS